MPDPVLTPNANKTARKPRESGVKKAGDHRHLRHGLYSANPGKFISIHAQRSVNGFRRGIEDAVLRLHGEIDIYRAALIQTATELCRIAIANRELAGSACELSYEERMAFDREYANILDRRDKKLKDLGLDARDVPGDDGLAFDDLQSAAARDAHTFDAANSNPPTPNQSPPHPLGETNEP